MRFANRWCQRQLTRALSLAVVTVLLADAGVAAEAEKKTEGSRTETQQKLEAAQKRLEEAAREVAELSASMSDGMVSPHVRSMIRIRERAMLGINIGDKADRDDGVEVLSVSPGGPAEAAGIKAGDVLLQAGGKALKREGSASPREKLLDIVREAKPGDKVAVSYRRDGKVATATITTEAIKDRPFTMPFSPGQMAKLEMLPNLAYWRSDGVFGSAELVSLTPKLGEYFGSDKGLLVVRAPADSRLQLQEGDVILDIDGRVPSSPSHALRILGSYQSGEKLKLNVLRMKKRLSVDITIPEGTWERTRERAHAFPHGPGFDFDVVMPAVPPAPVVAPMTPGVRVPAPPLPPDTVPRDGPV